MPTQPTIDVLGLGAVAVDDFLFVESYPPPDEKARVLGQKRSCGGLTAIALVAAARLGARCAYAGVLGRDELSRFALAYLKAEGIQVAGVRQTAAARPVHSHIVVDPQRGTRNIFYDLTGVVGAGAHTPASLVAASRVLFVDNLGVDGMIRAARLARRAGVPVVADFDSDRHPRFPTLLRLTDHLIISQSFAASLTGRRSPDRAARALADTGCQVAIVTCGEKGCWYWTRGATTSRHLPAFKVRAVDTTGCGDVFHGAYAYGLARQLPLEERIQLAAACAAWKAGRAGGPDAIPSLAAVRKFIRHELSRSSR